MKDRQICVLRFITIAYGKWAQIRREEVMSAGKEDYAVWKSEVITINLAST